MTDIGLTQSEADALLLMKKYDANSARTWDFPDHGGKIAISLVSEDRRERFVLDVLRGRISLRKGTYQTRGRTVAVLARLDFGGPPHRNPDGQDIDSPHLHLYREGYGDKWAYPVPHDRFPNLDDAWRTLQDFMRFSKVVKPPNIRRSLFT